MKKQAGFTLIELVIVIIILGILAVTAAPKFLNLQDDAKMAAADGVFSGVSSAMQLVYSKSALEGEEKAEKTNIPTPYAGSAAGVVATHFGYPTAAWAGIGKAISLDGAWKGAADGSTTPPTYQFYSTDKGGKAVNGSPCVIYTEAGNATAAVVKKGTVKGGKCA
ncbi:prepilin-type N-terminal cleavage/methylation domain-containing protein [Aeromonas caviae]|uniref:prepilin-type N-terminal cleavage/methylation domain-containing protein n=1 Tax=Aeromonas caviae TaxID=648 RepID=UPI002B251BE2|nr:prepilin-type N-terminal cleavage/methylation domain-containing protein [Aeromonas caviae]MEA9424704.1 prepilin-type N-terminal cleavage/methylation domain-containing protein [Aeromonas caviae]MEA9427129.1 prepilin-type N-terminal cleavage/methylation domain-containing protein [Aeromonas caviae]MEA9431737.1 prepilin-type N-terminal cleavage/methylation domain-containing protein [Aeromonas caviae]